MLNVVLFDVSVLERDIRDDERLLARAGRLERWERGGEGALEQVEATHSLPHRASAHRSASVSAPAAAIASIKSGWENASFMSATADTRTYARLRRNT